MLVTLSDAVTASPVQECRGERAGMGLLEALWSRFGFPSCFLLVHRNSAISKCIFPTYAAEL